ncbi:MAG: hypothetical protein WDZ49_13660 [Litorilinea sp.]
MLTSLLFSVLAPNLLNLTTPAVHGWLRALQPGAVNLQTITATPANAPLPSALLAVGLFLICLLLLAWFSRQIALYLQFPVYALTRSQDAAAVGLFLIFFPGVIVHESAHWLAARLMGLRTGAFRVWPRRQGKYIGLGSVSVQRSDPLRDSLVGIAPLLIGSALVALIGHRVFNVSIFGAELAQGEYWRALQVLPVALTRADAAIWAYLLFAIANAMMPSASDREPLKPVLLYGLGVGLIYLLLRLPIAPVAAALAFIMPGLQGLIAAFLFVIVLNFVVLSVLFLIRQLLPV